MQVDSPQRRHPNWRRRQEPGHQTEGSVEPLSAAHQGLPPFMTLGNPSLSPGASGSPICQVEGSTQSLEAPGEVSEIDSAAKICPEGSQPAGSPPARWSRVGGSMAGKPQPPQDPLRTPCTGSQRHIFESLPASFPHCSPQGFRNKHLRQEEECGRNYAFEKVCGFCFWML